MLRISRLVADLLLNTEVLSLIAEIDHFNGAWKAVNELEPERLVGLRKVATIESIGSSTRIEGARISNREVEALLRGLDVRTFASRDEEEVAGYSEAMERVLVSHADLPLSENFLQQLHGILLRYSGKDGHHRGHYKTLTNHVEAFGPDGVSRGVVFATSSPFETPLAMTDLMAWLRDSLAVGRGRQHSLLTIAQFVALFLAIHPFQDGNGRLSRVFTTLLLLQAGYTYVPYSSLESVIEANQANYYMALRHTQGSFAKPPADWEPWLLFFLHALRTQKRHLESRMLGIGRQLADMPAPRQKILELAAARGRVSVAEIMLATGAKRGSVKLDLSRLVRDGLLTRHGQGRTTWYVAAAKADASAWQGRANPANLEQWGIQL